ncbi:DUF2607 family protein [Vibrio sp. 404]|uniref:DUF2607 family protein n=1 Tax=Vibrio marinisediminis TaxID=2758441 RepID=A0A7W2FUK6_9VIBR|nr:DUF2607 family protein [Vibrio marinisediminis]MBA5764540.1 DUF2607 family protein [Vibrio marinisediminis]
MHRFERLSLRKMMVVLGTITLLLWTNFAVIDHQLDLNTHHHEHHHCQLFACVLHGAKASHFSLPIIKQPEPRPSLAVYHYLEVAVVAHSARAPPKLV